MTRTYETPVVVASAHVVATTNSSGTPPQENGKALGVDPTAGFCL